MSTANVDRVTGYPLLEALTKRRSRRFALGMKMDSGPLAFQSRSPALPLTEEEEALLVFAAAGITGHALLDLSFAPDQGGAIVARSLGRTIASGDGIQTVSLAVINDDATYLIKRPHDINPGDIPQLIEDARAGNYLELYRQSRLKIKNGRAAPPVAPMFNVNVNRWSLYAPGTSYFLPINELTFMCINGLLEIFNEHTGAFVVDERANFQPAGLKRFGRSHGGHLIDDPSSGCVLTVQRLEMMVTELVTVEQGMMLQNLGLMAQALGLGGFPNFAEHEFSWFEALDFRMERMRAGRYLGANPLVCGLMRLLGRNQEIPYAVGLERSDEVLLKPYCPPYYPSMKAAVQAVIDVKYGAQGLFRGGAANSAWREPQAIANSVADIGDAAAEATVAYCEYLYRRYGRFPVYMPPFRTVLGFQAGHLDVEFYDRHYRPESLSATERQHMEQWHGPST
ncbi:MAG TPA: hypothetical protein VMT22_24560 [Terriglobales bacterium]|nr:hypothetical protein [Terriglobales bacterium]